MNGLTLGSLFDGIGGFPFAAQRCGIETLWASEIEPNCIAITKRHFPGIAHLGSITEIDGGKIPPVDIISFGSPCQDLSVAGKQKGIDGARSGLFKEAIRIIYEIYQHSGYREADVAGTMTARQQSGRSDMPLIAQIDRAKLFIRYILRKLTPLECERLQGFPDYWTKYTATGAEIKDTPRYVALGNSLAVPCAERVFRGIIAVLSR